MGYAQKVYTVSKVPISADYWVEIRPLDADETKICNEAMFGGPLKGYTDPERTAAVEYQMHTDEYTLAVLSRCIVRWNVDDDDGAILPITEETVRKLHPRDQLRIIREWRTINNPLADEETRLG